MMQKKIHIYVDAEYLHLEIGNAVEETGEGIAWPIDDQHIDESLKEFGREFKHAIKHGCLTPQILTLDN